MSGPANSASTDSAGAAVRADGRGHMVERRFQLAQMKQAASQQEVARQHQPRSRLPLRRLQKFEAELPRLFQIAPHDVKDPGAAENHENIAIVEPSAKAPARVGTSRPLPARSSLPSSPAPDPASTSKSSSCFSLRSDSGNPRHSARARLSRSAASVSAYRWRA